MKQITLPSGTHTISVESCYGIIHIQWEPNGFENDDEMGDASLLSVSLAKKFAERRGLKLLSFIDLPNIVVPELAFLVRTNMIVKRSK